jgi:hypothetical protein
LTAGCLPIACFQERSHRPSRTVQVLRPTCSNASPFRQNRPRKHAPSHSRSIGDLLQDEIALLQSDFIG